MTGRHEDVRRARAEAQIARARLATTMASIQRRFSPSSLLRDAWEEVREHKDELAEEVMAVVRSRPATVAGLAGAATVLFARKPIRRLIVRLFSRRHATPDRDGGLEATNKEES